MTPRRYLGELELMVLLAVARLDPGGYGMRIRREIQRQTGRDLSIGAVYTGLERLERKGCVVSYWGQPTAVRGGRAPRHYRMTPTGCRLLHRSRSDLERMWEGLDLADGEILS